MADDQRQYITFYGIEYTDWNETFGSFVNHHKVLTQEYISDAASCPTSSQAHGEHKFLYPHHLKRTYYVEGRIEGEIAITTSSATATCNSYRVTLCKVHGDTNDETELATTGWVAVNKELAYDAGLGVGDECVFHFWIDCFQEQKVTDSERLYLKVEFNADASITFIHSNDSKWTDVWIEVPFKM